MPADIGSQLEAECDSLRVRVAELEAALARASAAAAHPAQDGTFLDHVLDNAPVILWATDREGVVTLSRGKALEVLGSRPGELVGRSVFDLYAHVPEAGDQVRQALAGEEVRSTLEVDGAFLQSWLAPLRDGAGKIRGVVGVSTVVTAQRRAERAYAETRQRLEILARLAPVGLFHTDPAGRPFYLNEQWCAIAGMTSEAAQRDGWCRALHPDDRDRVVQEWEAAVRNGRPFRSVYRFRRPDGATTCVLGQAEPEVDAAGRITSWVGTLTDITARKEAEEALQGLNEELESRVEERTRELQRLTDELAGANEVLRREALGRKLILEELRQSEGKWRSLVENVPDYILTLSRTGTILFINRTPPGATPEQVVGSTVFDHLPPERHDSFRRLVEAVLERGTPVSHEAAVVDRTGAQRWYAGRIGPIYSGDRVTALIVVATDVTRQKSIEEESRRKLDELAHGSRLATMGEMAAVLAHELNNPLAAIANYAHGGVRRLRMQRMNKAALIEVLEDVATQASRASETIRRLRSFLQKRELVQAEADCNRLVQDAVALVEPQARRREVLIERDLAEGLPAMLVDSIQIEQVLVNLLVNAMDAMEAAPAAERQIVVRTRATEGEVLVTVSDSGAGFPAGFDHRLFEPFFSTKPRGLGMGLSISRSIIEAHGGRLRAVPNECRGATFQFSLPAWPGVHDHGRDESQGCDGLHR